ncbi:YopX family protein [uncultured Tissierella sp.]|uniref:YopX family protein n=1 Tax=uncultured Tissierella sp. TaxID=448160 RepID=UPI0028048F53|nr:YopX family protein [uncultured Tissierella sp.]MDU5080251.1 YopX family protein [Bacillota bacterium]
MREIKFRGRRRDGVWIYGDLTGINHNTNEGSWCYINGRGVSKKTVGEYTGLHDKHGTEIYEGDILELVNEDGERIKAICKFGNRRLRTEYGTTIDIQCFYFQIGDRKTNPVVFNYKGMHDLDIMEVRGNIYENPELLLDCDCTEKDCESCKQYFADSI